MRAQPGAPPRPESLDGVDVHFAKAVAVLVAGVFPAGVTERLVPVAPGFQAGVDVVLVGVDQRARGDGGLDDRLDGRLLDSGQPVQHDVPAAWDQAEDGRLVLGQRAAPALAFQPAPSGRAPLLATAAGLPLCPATTSTSSLSTCSLSAGGGALAAKPARSCSVIAGTSLTARSSSRAIGRLDRFRPIRYTHSPQTRSG